MGRGPGRSRPSAREVDRSTRRGRGDRGTAILELALLLPFLAMIVFGSVDIGRTFSLQNRLTNMAREGATFAQFFPARVSSASSSDSCASGSVTSRTQNEDPSLAPVTITVTDLTTHTVLTGCDATQVAPGDQVQVKVVAKVKPVTPFVQVMVGSTYTLTGSIDVTVQG